MSLKNSTSELVFRLKITFVLAAVGGLCGLGGYLGWASEFDKSWGVIEYVKFVYVLATHENPIFIKEMALSVCAGSLILLIPFIILIVKKQGVNHG